MECRWCVSQGAVVQTTQSRDISPACLLLWATRPRENSTASHPAHSRKLINSRMRSILQSGYLSWLIWAWAFFPPLLISLKPCELLSPNAFVCFVSEAIKESWQRRLDGWHLSDSAMLQKRGEDFIWIFRAGINPHSLQNTLQRGAGGRAGGRVMVVEGGLNISLLSLS